MQKTKRLENEKINIDLNVNSTEAAELLKRNVSNVGKSTICNLLFKKDVPIIKKGNITEICINDFTTKKKKILPICYDRYHYSQNS